jgi:hypothetical protein
VPQKLKVRSARARALEQNPHTRAIRASFAVGTIGRVRRLLPIALAALCAALLAGPAAAALRAQVPAFTLKRIQANAGDASYLPTRLPLGYRYERWQLRNGTLVVTFKHTRSGDRFTFQAERLPRGAACDGGGAFNRILQMDGNKVYYGGSGGEWIAWRCVTSPKSHQRYVLSVHSRGPLPDVALARVAASGKRFARS